MRRRGAADDNIHARELLQPVREGHRAAPQFRGQRPRLVGRTIGHRQAAGAARNQRARSLFARVARADDQHLAVAKAAENLFRQLHGDRPDGDAAALDVGLGADVFGDVEGALKGPVEPGAGMAMLAGQLIRLFKLAQNLRFPEHHRIQPAGHAEKMLDALRLAQRVNPPDLRVGAILGRQQEFPQPGQGAGRLPRRGGVDLNAVAGGQDDRLISGARASQRLQRRRHARRVKRKALPHRHRRGMMTQAKDENRHGKQSGTPAAPAPAADDALGRMRKVAIMGYAAATGHWCPRRSAAQRGSCPGPPARSGARPGQSASAK